MKDSDIITILSKKVSDLELEIVKLHHMLKLESDSSTKHINEIYKRVRTTHDYVRDIDKSTNQNISTLYDMVSPIEQKIFPEVSKVRLQLASIAERPDFSSGEESDKKKP